MISFEKSIGAAVWRRQNGNIEYLLLQYRSGQWDFPKGHVEDAESELMTLRRELQEETGTDAYGIDEHKLATVRYFYKAKGTEFVERRNAGRGVYIFKKVSYYLAELPSDQEIVLNFENKAFIWLSYAEAKNKISNSDSKRVIEKANDRINS